jgi:hypothetical protein
VSDPIAQVANATNNAQWQELRLERWSSVRDALWQVIAPVLDFDARVALVGAGSCDDLPLARILDRAGHVDLIDFDTTSTQRAVARLDDLQRARCRIIEDDVTAGAADVVLRAARGDAPMPNSLELPYGALGSGDYDLVVGDMLYSQLLHPGLMALKLESAQQLAIMGRYDNPLTTALVTRLQSSLAPGGHAVHVHDVACWSSGHPQPVELADALLDPITNWPLLRRHDNCDPHLALERLRVPVVAASWWEWPFEPNKRFIVRATLAAGGVRP